MMHGFWLIKENENENENEFVWIILDFSFWLNMEL